MACNLQATLSGLLDRGDSSAKPDSRALVEVKPSADQRQAVANAQTLRRLLATQRALTGRLPTIKPPMRPVRRAHGVLALQLCLVCMS